MKLVPIITCRKDIGEKWISCEKANPEDFVWKNNCRYKKVDEKQLKVKKENNGGKLF